MKLGVLVLFVVMYGFCFGCLKLWVCIENLVGFILGCLNVEVFVFVEVVKLDIMVGVFLVKLFVLYLFECLFELRVKGFNCDL